MTLWCIQMWYCCNLYKERPHFLNHICRWETQIVYNLGHKDSHLRNRHRYGVFFFFFFSIAFFHSEQWVCVHSRKRVESSTWVNARLLSVKLRLSYVYTLQLIGPISYPGKCDLMIRTRKHSVIFSRMHLLPSFVYNIHQDTKSARLIAVCKRTFTHCD